MYEFLKNAEFFAEIPEADLERLCRMAEEVKLSAGQELFSEGSFGDRAYILIEGELEIVKASDGREVLLKVQENEPGLVIGEMALLEKVPRMATVRAGTGAVLLAIHKEQFEYILDASPGATRAMLRTVLQRWRNNEARLHQSEKMAQLGTLTAGIAHELNNPAAALRRSASQLESVIVQLMQAQAQTGRLNLTQAQQDILRDLAGQAREQAAHPQESNVLDCSDRERDLEKWLEARGVTDAWEFVPILVNMDYDVAKLANLAQHFSSHQLPAVMTWLGSIYLTYDLLGGLGQDASRISEIVKALKSYAYLDQTPVQTVDVHTGLNNSLLVLRHKLGSGIRVQRHYAPDLPQFQAYGAELNQVWTSIIDNAIDALKGQGEIIIRTRREGKWVVVEIEDNGPGISPEIQSRIFDPFFTTKPPGQGAGLGLEMSHNIVVHRHRGEIKVSSKPGQTCFQIWLPYSPQGSDNT